MTDRLEAAIDSLVDAINETTDPLERYQAIKGLEKRLDLVIKQAKADVANELYEGNWTHVGKLLGVTGTRAKQISECSR